MKKLLILGNWKSNKGVTDAIAWFAQIMHIQDALGNEKTAVLFPSFPLLFFAKQQIAEKSLPLYLGAQNISPFPKGAYTGEVAAAQIKEFADYVLIGHSERRQYFHETDEVLAQKTELAVQAGLQVVYCVQNEETIVPKNAKIVAYEPVSAIGTGHPDTPEAAATVAHLIKKANPQVGQVVYGGSVTSRNVASFTQMEHIDGVLPGGASLDPHEFLTIIKNA